MPDICLDTAFDTTSASQPGAAPGVGRASKAKSDPSGRTHAYSEPAVVVST